jgi:murein lipoprotein
MIPSGQHEILTRAWNLLARRMCIFLSSADPRRCTVGQNRIVGVSVLSFDDVGLVIDWKKCMSRSVKLATAAVILVGAVSLSGCATKSYVREQIAPVSQRVDALDAKLQETDRTAKSALAEAQAASGQAQNNGQRLDQLTARVDSAEQQLVQVQQKQQKRTRH